MKFEDLLAALSDRVRTMKAQGVSSKKEDAAKVAALEGNERNDMWKKKVESPPKPNPTKGQKTIKCFICNASHPLEKCNKLLNMPLERRAEILKKDGRCYRCLEKADHIAKFCQSEGFKCGDCNYNHPTILCGWRQLMQKKRQEQIAAGAPKNNPRQPKTAEANANSNSAGSNSGTSTSKESAPTASSATEGASHNVNSI